MKFKFKHDLFIAKNTPELRNNLEELGYRYLQNGYGEWYIPIEKLLYLTTDRRGFYKGTMANWDTYSCKDCGTDEKMFLELAKELEEEKK